MNLQTKIGIAAALLAAAFAFGRWSAPTKIKTETKIVEVEKKTEETKKDENKNKKTTTHTKVSPDGTRETTTTTVETDRKSTDRSRTDDKSTTQVITKEVEKSKSYVTISALAGMSFKDLTTPFYGGSLSKPVLGPITLGVWGLTNGTGGVSIGLTF